MFFSGYGQNKNSYEERWKQLNKGFKYEKSNGKKGPQKGFIYPSQLSEEGTYKGNQHKSQPSQDNIIYSREKRYKNSDGNGVKQNIKKEKGHKLDDIKAPETEAPDVDFPDWEGPDWDLKDGKIFKVILIIIIIALLAFLIYYFLFKNKTKSNKTISTVDYNKENDINPESLEENELTTELENAITNNDYRLAVRLYYVLLLKTLIELNQIKWEKRKTNMHYLIEMSNHKGHKKFSRAVLIYEWSWYGKNYPSERDFEMFSRFFNEFLKQLKDEK